MARERVSAQHLCDELDERLSDEYTCEVQDRVVYDLRYNSSHEVEDQSFKTDIAIRQAGVPRVIIEVKRDGVTSHDLMVHDEKAQRHKSTYPFLRYGIIAFEMTENLNKRYLWHTSSLDFFALSSADVGERDDLDSQEMEKLKRIVQQNIESSHKLERILENDTEHRMLTRDVQLL